MTTVSKSRTHDLKQNYNNQKFDDYSPLPISTEAGHGTAVSGLSLRLEITMRA